MSIFTNDWKHMLEAEFKKDYFIKLQDFLEEEYKSQTIYPPKEDLYTALNLTSYRDTRVLILGQDPYHGPNQSHGLCFSVRPGTKIPPSLRNIYKELADDEGCDIPNNGYLVKWAKQGILMLNAVMTVRKGQANSHKGRGWENFTDRIIQLLDEREKPVIFILWGRNAQEKEKLITSPRHYIIKSVHPSPLSAHRGFFGSKVFSRSNEILKNIGDQPIDWQIEDL